LPKWNYEIDKWITEALKKNRLGRNEIYHEVNKRYKKARHKTISLSKDVIDGHLKFLIQNGIVDKNDVGRRGTRIEHFLTPEAIRQLQTKALDLKALKNHNKKQVEITRKTKFKALYILILMFNHTTSFKFRNEDELISFLAPFHLKLNKTSIARLANEHESDEIKEERIEFQDKGVIVSMHDYVNRYHGGVTSVYNCQIRGMTKNSVISNRIDKPFQYLSFSSNQLDEAFDLLCRDQILQPVPHSGGDYIYRIADNNLYFLLFFLEDLFSEYVMPVMRKLWKYHRYPTPEERQWLTMLEGEVRVNRLIIEYNEYRQEIGNKIRQEAGGIETVVNKKLHRMKMNTINEIEDQLKSIQEDLNNYPKKYDFIMKKYLSLRHIFEIMFPEFLRRLELR
jgi:DNA-binding HxlR family transcriptional regulator